MKPTESLDEAKIQVAKALGAFPEAVKINCQGQILADGNGSLADLLESFPGEGAEPPLLFAVVNQDRMELGRHLGFLKKDLVDCRRLRRRCQDLSSELTHRQRVLRLRLDSLPEIQIVRTEEQLNDLGDKVAEAVMHWEDLRYNLQEKVWHAREDLKTMLEGSEELHQILEEFDEESYVPEPHSLGFCTCWSCLGPHEPSCEFHLQDLCPRLFRREMWQNSKGSWKLRKEKVEKLEPHEDWCHQEPKGPWSSKPKSPHKSHRRMMRSDIKNQLSQLREQSLKW